ncbi:glycosyltransferase [Pedobacter sp. PWIIR3]
MKIIFICGSLEPGKDGVGDYVRQLAYELVKLGHLVSIIALNDRHIKERDRTYYLFEFGKIEVFRFPEVNLNNEDINLIKHFIEEIQPDVLNLQYVSFSFHPKGLPFRLAKVLTKLAGGCKWNIMFHELWIGMSTESTYKERLLGFFQKLVIKNLIKVLQPSSIFTQTTLYMELLSQMGTSAEYLPLFSNIPVKSHDDIKSKFNCDKSLNRDLEIVTFGGLHHGAPIEKLAKEAAEYQKLTLTKVKLLLLGRNGQEQTRWASIWRANGLDAECFGEKSPDEISEILSSVRYGFFTTPFQLLEKSGSVAAMREHRINLLCVARNWKARGHESIKNNPFGIVEYQPGCLNDFLKSHGDFTYVPTLTNVAIQYVKHLEKYG